MITYRLACSIGALVCVILFAIFLVAPGSYMAGYGVSPDQSGLFLGTRAAPLFLGLAAFCWLLRGNTDPQVRWAVSLSMSLTFLGIAVTGLWDFWQGEAANMIVLAAFGETALAAIFIVGMRSDT